MKLRCEFYFDNWLTLETYEFAKLEIAVNLLFSISS